MSECLNLVKSRKVNQGIKFMGQFLIQNQWIILIAVLWTIPWRGVALWRAAKNNHKWWFIALFVINTLAILEILYIFVFSKKRKDLSQETHSQ